MRRVHSWGFFATVCCTCFAGCQLVFGFDHPPEDTGGHGGSTTQGGGGTATTTSSQGGGGVTTTTSGGGGGGTTTTTTDPCTDSTQDGIETDVDCGGGECPKCAISKTCLVSADCETGFCADGVCCNEPCTGVCRACSAAKKGQGEDGICEPVKLGPEPDGACPAGNICDGMGTCKADLGQVCVGAADCASSFCVDGYCCDNACVGTCHLCNVPSKEGTCSPTPAGTDDDGECSGAAPADNCNGFGGCGIGPLGGTCILGMAAACQSGNCVDGYCCDTSCDAKCVACRGDYTGGTSGICAALTGIDPENECPGAQNCIGNDACGP